MACVPDLAISPDCAYCGAAPGPGGACPADAAWGCLGARDLAAADPVDGLRADLAAAGRRRSVVVLGARDDPYSVEHRHATRPVLRLLAELGHAVVLTTRSAQIVQDADLLSSLAHHGLARIFMAIGTLGPALSRELEPQASPPSARIDAIARLAESGLHIGVLLSPVIPGLTSTDLESVLDAAAGAGAAFADYALVQLSREARETFGAWLTHAHPRRARHVIGLLKALDTDSQGAPGDGAAAAMADYAAPLARRFDVACRRFLLDRVPAPACCRRFEVPPAGGLSAVA